MKRIIIKLDPGSDKYKRLDEDGYAKVWAGPKIMAELPETGKKYVSRPHNFWNPPGTEWLLPKPRQWNGGWVRDERLVDHVLVKDLWTFASGVLTPREYSGSKKADGTDFPANKWMTFHVPQGVTSLDARDYQAMGAEAGVTIPASTKTVAFCSSGPTGVTLGDGRRDYHPHISFRQYPHPDDLTIFGWSNLAVIFFQSKWYLLHSPLNDGKTWERLQMGDMAEGLKSTYSYRWTVGEGGASEVYEDTIFKRQFAAIPVGQDSLYLSFYPGGEIVVPLRTTEGSTDPGPLFPTGAWWIAVPENRNVDCQWQVIGYETASTDSLNDPDPLTFFDLGPNYRPTLQPQLLYQALQHAESSADLVNTTTNNEAVLTLGGASAASNERIIIGVRDEEYAQWDSDGTHHSGSLRLHLRPNTTGFNEAGYLAPQIRFAGLAFAQKLTSRSSVSLDLTDDQWVGLSVTLSLRELMGKRIRFGVWDAMEEVLGALGLDTRERYPCEIWQDTDEDGEGDLLLARGWVMKCESEELQSEAGDADPTPLRYFSFEAQGLTTRADEQWLHSPEIVDPDGSGHVTHLFAIKDALRKSGFDVDDEDLFFWANDPLENTAVGQLPGTPGDLKDLKGLESDGPYNPDWGEPKTDYIRRIAEQWRLWSLYEGDTRIYYHPNLVVALLTGGPYYSVATIHRTNAEAEAAGVSGQYTLARPRRAPTEMPCTTVRVTGKTPEREGTQNKAVHWIDENLKALTDASHPDFVGDRHILGVVTKLAVGERALKQIARGIRFLRARRVRGWVVEVPLAPWQMQPGPVSVGEVVTLRGKGDCLITGLTWKVLGWNAAAGDYHYRTELTCEQLPEGAEAGASRGTYPGSGVMEGMEAS